MASCAELTLDNVPQAGQNRGRRDFHITFVNGTDVSPAAPCSARFAANVP